MKITENLADLVLELGKLESFEIAGLIIDCDGVSVKKLLELFSQTTNHRSKEVVKEIFDEVGYGWVTDLDDMGIRAVIELKEVKNDHVFAHDQGINVIAFDSDTMFSETEFLDLTPASTYFH